MSRSFNIDDFRENAIQVVLLEPIDNQGEENFTRQINAIERWCDESCKSDFLILVNSVWFQDERDALIFKLKFGK